MKLRSSAIGLIPLLINILLDSGIVGVNESNVERYVRNSPRNVAPFIMDNFDKFVNEYNKSFDDVWKATYVDDVFDITIDIIDDVYQGVFLDFDDDNGYAVVGNDYTFLDFSSSGKSPYKGIESDSFYYSTLSGYLYLNGDEYVNVNDEYASDDHLDELNYETYAGQKDKETGCGHIEDTDLYVKDRYGDGWTLSKEKSLDMAIGKYTHQFDLSCYYYNELVGNRIIPYYSEGNCWMVSAYNILQSIADAKGSYKKTIDSYKTDKSKPSMESISDVVSYNPKDEEPKTYGKFFDENGQNLSNVKKTPNGYSYYERTLKSKTSSFPELYTSVRKYASDKWSKVDGGTTYGSAKIINEVGRQYGYDFKAKGTSMVGIYNAAGIKAIDFNLPFGLITSSMSNAGYDNHAMAGCGYKIYSKKCGWWIFSWTNFKYFYELRDGHNYDKIYFDQSAWRGLGGMILLDFKYSKYN